MTQRARLGRYALWQARDFIYERAASIIVIGALLVFASGVSMNPATRSMVAHDGYSARHFTAMVVTGGLAVQWLMFSLIAVYGTVSNDRTSGRFRLLFAKPVSAVRYYAQAFAVHGVLMLLCAAIATALTRVIVPITLPLALDVMAIFGAAFLLVGGTCFLFSAIWRFDWVSTVGVWGLTVYLQSKFVGAQWMNVFPPFWKISQQIEQLKELDPIEPKQLLWVAGYGVACFLLGLIVVRRRPLAA